VTPRQVRKSLASLGPLDHHRLQQRPRIVQVNQDQIRVPLEPVHLQAAGYLRNTPHEHVLDDYEDVALHKSDP
jgi:hypothetical protein